MKLLLLQVCAVILMCLFPSGNGMAQAAGKAPASNAPYDLTISQATRPFSRLGVDAHISIGGLGFDVATPLAGRFNLRTGADFFNVSEGFLEQGAQVQGTLHLLAGHASVDWFPFAGRFRLSPTVVFANNNRLNATVLVPGGSTITLNGTDYIASSTDPLHGSAAIAFRRVSPGFTLGFGNIVPRLKSHHFSVPVELGFFYTGQPTLAVSFTGSACDPTLPPAIGCESVNQDPDFQHDLAAFIARNNNNLSYASFFPIFSLGVGYAF